MFIALFVISIRNLHFVYNERILYFFQCVNTLQFHPHSTILVSGGEDRRVNFFDYTKSTVKKAFKCITVSVITQKIYVLNICEGQNQMTIDSNHLKYFSKFLFKCISSFLYLLLPTLSFIHSFIHSFILSFMVPPRSVLVSCTNSVICGT